MKVTAPADGSKMMSVACPAEPPATPMTGIRFLGKMTPARDPKQTYISIRGFTETFDFQYFWAFFGFGWSNTVSWRSGMYPESFLEPVASLSSSMARGEPWRPYSAPKLCIFCVCKFSCNVIRLRKRLCGHKKSVGSQKI